MKKGCRISVYPFVMMGFFLVLLISCKKDAQKQLPSVSTIVVSGITINTANAGGNVTSDGGESITAKGVCWSVNQNPSISNYLTNEGTGVGSFLSVLNGLSPNTSYFLRAYATNSVGTAYGVELTFKTNSESISGLAKPILNLPANNSTQISLQTTLIWGSVISATSYDIQVSTNSQFIDPLYGFMDLVSTAKTLTNLNYNTTYYWRVRAKNSGSLSDWSDIWNFTTQNATGTAPIANYTASPLTTIIGQSVQFTDLSTNTPTSWLWNFGDGGTSTLQNPSHSYNVAGTYTVSLKTTNSFGDNTKTMSNYIIINSTSMPDGLVAYYPFNGNANDESGNGLNLTTKGTPTLTVSRKNLPNSAFSLNGTTDYFIRASNTLLLPTNEFSMCAWVYSTGIDGIQDVIISTLGNSAGNGYQMHLDNTNNTIGGFMRRTDATYVDLQNPVSSYLNNWTFVVFTYSNVTGTKLYLNNQLKKETTNLFQIQYGNINDFYVGTNYNLSLGAARMFKGKIDDIRIYNKALSPSEIDLLFKE